MEATVSIPVVTETHAGTGEISVLPASSIGLKTAQNAAQAVSTSVRISRKNSVQNIRNRPMSVMVVKNDTGVLSADIYTRLSPHKRSTKLYAAKADGEFQSLEKN